MCGRFTVKATWAELMALYRLTMDAPPHNLRPRYKVCPTDPVDVVTAEEGKRELVPMRWGPHPALVEQNHQRREDSTFNARPRRSRPSRSFVTHSWHGLCAGRPGVLTASSSRHHAFAPA